MLEEGRRSRRGVVAMSLSKPVPKSATAKADLKFGTPEPERQFSMEQLFGKFRSIEKRFPGLSGRLLDDVIFKCYAIPGKHTIQYYDDDGREALHRHRINERHHDAVVEEYVEGILTSGVQPAVRGECWAVARKDGYMNHYDLISWGTLTISMYEAVRRTVKNGVIANEQVNTSVEAGIPGCTLWNPDTPADVMLYLKEYHNKWHKGAGTSFMERLVND